MSAPYFDKVLSDAQVQSQLGQLDAVELPAKSKPGQFKVFRIRGGGEALVRRAKPGMLQLQLYAGACAC